MRFGTPATRLTTTGSAFGAVYAGATNFTYKIRTNTATGTGAITLHVISDFGPANEFALLAEIRSPVPVQSPPIP